MSLSPAKGMASTNGATPPGGSRPLMRKKAPTSIFTQKKKPAGSLKKQAGQNGAQVQARPAATSTTNTVPTAPEEQEYTDYPIFVMKDALAEGLHYHAMRFQNRPGRDGGNISVNPYDENQFTRPVQLHRRNARERLAVVEQSDAASGVDDKERELMNAKRAERQAEREANQALIAPTGGETSKPLRKKPQKKVEDVYYNENNPRQRERAQLRYEEARPWHLEDFDSKNVWIGSYEEPMSESSVLFEIGNDGFKMVPVEKWYKFTQTNRVGVMDSDAVEKHMAMKVKAPRWFRGTQEENDEARRQAARRLREERLAEMRGGQDDEVDRLPKKEDYQADVDEIDFEFNDEFQDDDEGFIFGAEQDEETKETEKRVREEMRGANLAGTGVKDEDRDWDAEEQQEKLKEQEEKRRTKRMRKQLIKKERKNEYDSDSDRGEFSESSESEDSEEERERLEEEREGLEEDKKREERRKVNGEKSGSSTRGTNTPTGRAEKRDNAKLFAASRKRPGSPDLSEMSGNELSRKKVKGVNGRAMSGNTPNGARSLSPDAPKAKTTTLGGSGSGSDTETSRAGRPKIRLKNSPPASPHEGSPRGSRSGSPAGTGSRAQSPQRQAPAFPTLEEVRAAIPEEGVVINALVKQFKQRVGGRGPDFIALVKSAGKQDAVTKKIMPKPLGV